jgi:hypothetical protein
VYICEDLCPKKGTPGVAFSYAAAGRHKQERTGIRYKTSGIRNEIQGGFKN